MAKTAVGLAVVVMLAACVASEPPARGTCGAEGMQDLIGRDAAVIAAMTLPVGTRIITPGMAITEDYSEARLNIDLDDAGRISRVWCG